MTNPNLTQPEMSPSGSSDAAIRELIATFVAAWNTADSARLASVFTQDADFTAITGQRARGREIIARGHDEIFRTIYRGTRNSASVEAIHFLRPDVAVLDVKFTLRAADGSLAFGIPFSSAGIIATRDDDKWRISVFRNMIPFVRPMAGPVEQRQAQAQNP